MSAGSGRSSRLGVAAGKSLEAKFSKFATQQWARETRNRPAQELTTENCARKLKTRKTRRKKKNSCRFRIMYANCRGVKGKKMSLKGIVEVTDPDIIVLNETWYKNNEETKLKAYKSFTSNRENKKGGGIEILVRNNVQKNW